MLGVRAMKEFGLTGLPVTHVENASATGLVAFRDAAWAVSSGRCDVAMALGFDKMTDMMRRHRRAGARLRPRPHRLGDPARRVLRAVGDAAHARARHPAVALRGDRGEELEPRRAQSAVAPPARPRVTAEEVLASPQVAEPLTAMMACPVSRRRRVRDRRARRPRAEAASRAAARGRARVGAAERALHARPHLPRAGRRSGDDDARHRARGLRRRGHRARGRRPRLLSRRLRQRGARVLRAARLLSRRRGREAASRKARRRSAGASRSTPTAA